MMNRFVKYLSGATVSAAALVAALGAAEASSFAIRSGQGAEGLGMAYAGASSGGTGLSGIAWNPAVITMFPGRNSNWNITYLKATADYEITRRATAGGVPINFIPVGLGGPGTQTGTGNIGGDGAVIPASYNAWQLTDRLWVGLATGAPWGLRSKPENQYYAGQTYARSGKIRSINVSPTIGYQVNDWLSVGAAVQGQYFKARLSQATSLGPNARPAILDGDNFSWGYRIGATITPMKGTTIGIAYRSSIRHQLEGTFDGIAPISVPIKVNLNLPDSVVFGLSQQINDRWQAHLGVEWTNWSRFRRLPIVSQLNGLPVSSLNFVYDDSWFFSGGLEYKYSDALTLRAGLGYELSAVNDSNRTFFISDNDRAWFSVGGSYKFSQQLSMDVGYSYIAVKKAPVDYNAITHPQFRNVDVAGVAKPDIHIVSLGLSYRWDNPQVAQPAAAVVRKY